MSITGNWERRRLSRRDFLAASGMSAAALALGAQGLWLPRRSLAQTQGGYFQLGVASGDPQLYGTGSSQKASVVLWTRLAPGTAFVRQGATKEEKQPLVEKQGDPLHGEGDLTLGLEVKKVATGESVQTPGSILTPYPPIAYEDSAHSVHHVVDGLDPGTRYSYKFTFVNESDDTLPATPPEGEKSTVGYFKTPATQKDSLTFAFASCQHWENGLYGAYLDIANRAELDLVVHLGDYIYEGAPSSKANRNLPADRVHSAIEDTSAWCNTLFDSRTRHAQYKTDPDLQAAHAAHLWLVTWDDHEVENDYAGLKSWYDHLNPVPADFAERRAAAYQAYYEHMPLRPDSRTVTGGKVTNVQLNRQVTYGSLIQFLVLDTRQFRTEQPCGDQGSLIESSCKERSQDPILDGKKPRRRHSILSAEGGMNLTSPWTDDVLEKWLKEPGKLTSPPYKWNVLAQQVPIFQYNHYDWTGNWYSESWDSYAAVRGRIFNHIAQNNVPNAVVITGDMHSSWAANLEKNFNDKTVTDIVGTEFCPTSISSTLSKGAGSWDETYKNAFNRSGNKHVKFYNGNNGGYGLCTVDNNRWTTEYYLAGSSTPMKTYWVYAKGSGPSGAYGVIDPKTDRPAVPTLSTDA